MTSLLTDADVIAAHNSCEGGRPGDPYVFSRAVEVALLAKLAAQAGVMPEPYTVASTLKCSVCGAAYVPTRYAAPMAAHGVAMATVPPYACKCGSTQFFGTVGYDSPSPAIYTADQLRTYSAALAAERLVLREAAQAVLDRWDSPKWEWVDHGPTAGLMHNLRAALNPATGEKEKQS